MHYLLLDLDLLTTAIDHPRRVFLFPAVAAAARLLAALGRLAAFGRFAEPRGIDDAAVRAHFGCVERAGNFHGVPLAAERMAQAALVLLA